MIRRVTKRQLTLLFAFIVSMIMYMIAPLDYDFNYNLICGVYFILTTILYYRLNPRDNYLDFDFIFLVGYFFVMFFYPIFIHPVGTTFFAFQYEFRANVINQATGLSLMGICAFFLGRTMIKNEGNHKPLSHNSIIPTQLLFYIATLTFLVFIASGSFHDLMNLYAEGGRHKSASGIGNYMFLLTTSSIMCLIVIWMYNLYITKRNNEINYHIPRAETLLLGSVVFLILFAGSRTVPLQIILILCGLYAYLFRPFALKKVFLLTLIGFIGMFGILLFRSGGGYELNSVGDLAMDLIINNRNSFVAIDYVDRNGLSFGRSMIGVIAAPIPFLQNILTTLFGLDPRSLTSSLIITTETIGSDSSLGLGTNIIADIYMAFGSVGVVAFMIGLGSFISYLMKSSKYNIYSLTCYGIMMSYAIFLVRAEFFFPLRLLIWCLVMINISVMHPVRFKISKAI